LSPREPNRHLIDDCASVREAGPLAVHAPTGPHAPSLCEGHVLGEIAALSGAQPLSLAPADLDED
jgi:hypothetical protein